MRQHIDRLVPLAEVLGHLATIAPVAPRRVPTATATGLVLAEPIRPPHDVPPRRVAAIDGWAVPAEPTFGASPYAPAPLTPGVAVAVDAATPLPNACDAVLAPEWVTTDGMMAEALQPVAPGEGVRAKGEDAKAGMALLAMGHRLRPSDIALLMACGVAAVSCRSVRIVVVNAAPQAEATAAMIAALLAPWLGAAAPTQASGADGLATVLLASEGDMILTVGGTGPGSMDATIATLARIGHVAFHGLGIDPGATTAFGRIGDRPVLALPGRIEAALGACLLVGRPLLRHLEGGMPMSCRTSVGRLARKIAVTAGRTRLIFVQRDGNDILPLGGSGLPLHHLAQANGFVILPPEAEGLPAGAEIPVQPLPGLFGSDT